MFDEKPRRKLQTWEEAAGKLKSITKENGKLHLLLESTILTTVDDTTIEDILRTHVGQEIGILRTETGYLIRTTQPQKNVKRIKNG